MHFGLCQEVAAMFCISSNHEQQQSKYNPNKLSPHRRTKQSRFVIEGATRCTGAHLACSMQPANTSI